MSDDPLAFLDIGIQRRLDAATNLPILAKLVGCSKNTLYDIRNGATKASQQRFCVVYNLCKEFNIDLQNYRELGVDLHD